MAQPSSVATILPDLLKQLGLADAAAGWKAVSEWPAVAGARIARVTSAIAFHDGTLHVEVEGSAWMHELGFLRRDLVRNLNRHLGADVVRDVRFTPKGSHSRKDGSGGSLR